MYFEALKIFCDVVRHNSFSRAAGANRISQSAASQNVLQLEKSLGVRLIDRSKRPFQLTPEGQVYYEGCRGLVERYYAVEAEVKDLSREVAGAVSVAAIYSVGLSDMSRYVQEFAAKYPKATVKLAYLHPDRVYDSVLNEEADLGLVSFPKARKGLVALAWRTEPMVFVCAAGHPLAVAPEIRPRDLARQPMVAFDHGLVIWREIERYLRKDRVEPQVRVAFDNIETIKRAVEIGEGVAILPKPTVVREVQAGTLVTVPLAAPGMVRPLGILHRKNGSPSQTTRRFLELLQHNGGEPEEATLGVAASEGATDGNGHASGWKVTA